MTNLTSHPLTDQPLANHSLTEVGPLVTEEYIVTTIQGKATAYPSAKAYGRLPAEWIEDIEAIELLTEVRDKYEVRLAALHRENARLAEEVKRLQPNK